MKFIITENKLEKVVLAWMNKNFSPDQLETVEHPDYPDSILFKKNGVVVMLQDMKFKRFWFDYDNIWSFFESFFGMKYQQIQQVLTKWLEETLNLEGYTPSYRFGYFRKLLEETLKLEGYTPTGYIKK